jgi:hypothetical protein
MDRNTIPSFVVGQRTPSKQVKHNGPHAHVSSDRRARDGIHCPHLVLVVAILIYEVGVQCCNEL